MSTKKAKSSNGQIFDIASKRLKLKRREKIVLQRLLGFLVRNNKPFPYSNESLSFKTGYSRSSVFESINLLEKLRLIVRTGYTNQVKFFPGTILLKIITLVQNHPKYVQVKKPTLVQKLDEFEQTSPVSGYNKTYISLKLKEKGPFIFISNQATGFQVQEIVWHINANVQMPDNLKMLFKLDAKQT